MFTYDEILSIKDPEERKAQRNQYDFDKISCQNDMKGIKCVTCRRRRTTYCFDPEKEKKEGWKWS